MYISVLQIISGAILQQQFLLEGVSSKPKKETEDFLRIFYKIELRLGYNYALGFMKFLYNWLYDKLMIFYIEMNRADCGMPVLFRPSSLVDSKVINIT